MFLPWWRRAASRQSPSPRRGRLRPAPRGARPRLSVERLEDRVLLTNGMLDPTFGNGGQVLTQFTPSTFDQANSVVLQTVAGNNYILVAGSSAPSGTSEFVLARYTSTGALDTNFGTNGYVLTSFGGVDHVNSVAVQSNGDIVVAGESSQSDGPHFALARYLPNGTPDSTFGTNGTVLSSHFLSSIGDYAYSVAVDGNGNILLAGYSDQNGDVEFALARYTSAGTLDTSFDQNGPLPGLVLTQFPGSTFDEAFGMAVDANGNILLAGTSDQSDGNHFALARYTPTGVLDTSFNPNGSTPGEVLTPLLSSSGDHGDAVAVQSTGNIVVAGVSGNQFALVRYTSTGRWIPVSAPAAPP